MSQVGPGGLYPLQRRGQLTSPSGGGGHSRSEGGLPPPPRLQERGRPPSALPHRGPKGQCHRNEHLLKKFRETKMLTCVYVQLHLCAPLLCSVQNEYVHQYTYVHEHNIYRYVCVCTCTYVISAWGEQRTELWKQTCSHT